MKKLLFSCVVFLCSALFVRAQDGDVPVVDFGFKGGLNASYIGETMPTDYEADGVKIGLTLGAFSRIKLADKDAFYIQPELLWSQTGSRFSNTVVENANTKVRYETSTNLTNLDIPVLIGARVGIKQLGIRLHFGPVFSQILEAKNKVKTITTIDNITNTTEERSDILGNVNKTQFGGQVGIAVDFFRMNFDLRYQHSFTKLYKTNPLDDARVSNIHLTVGFKVF
jgi:hypothetical protein